MLEKKIETCEILCETMGPGKVNFRKLQQLRMGPIKPAMEWLVRGTSATTGTQTQDGKLHKAALILQMLPGTCSFATEQANGSVNTEFSRTSLYEI